MASAALFSHSLQGQAGLPNYEQLKEEHDLGVLEAPGVPAGATAIRMPHERSECLTPQVYAPPPHDHILWSICSLVYCNFFCLGFLALLFSVKARDRKVIGDYSGAASYGSTAKSLNLVALLVNILVVVIAVVVIVVVIVNIQPQ